MIPRRPPGVVLLAVGYGAGLATGLARFPDLRFVAAFLLVATWLLRDEWWVAVVPALAAGTVVGTTAAGRARSSCAARLPLGAREYELHAIDPGGGTGRVDVRGTACTGAVTATWPRAAHFAAGRTVTALARWTPAAGALGRPDGILVVERIDSIRGRATGAEEWRSATAVAARALYGPRAALVEAFVIGWRGDLDPALRAGFASAGLLHLLTVSGLVIGCIAAWVVLVLRVAGAGRQVAHAIAVLVMLGYVVLLGWPAAATRAVVALAIVAFCRWRQRQVAPGALLASCGVAVLLIDPWSIASAAAWMSICGCGGMIVALRWSDRALGRRWWIRAASGSVGAVVATAPVAAAAFGQVALIGIILNLVAMPLMVLLVPLVFASLLLHTALPAVAASLAASGNGLLALVEVIARAGSRVPGAATQGATGHDAAIPWLAAIAAGLWITAGRTTIAEAVRRAAWVAVGVTWVALARDLAHAGPPDTRSLALLFVDVGQGDAALIRTPVGHWIEVDAGPAGDGWDAGRRVIAPLLLREHASRIDIFVLSHAHRDHVGGGSGVLDRIPVDVAIEPGELFADTAYDEWLGALAIHHTRWRAAQAGTGWTVDGVAFRVLHPPRPWPRQGEDLNEDSIVLEVSFGEFRALLMGDAGFVAESAMAGSLRPVDLLKVGHHGSKTASSEAFLAAVRPQAAVVSVGRNHYGHPAPETLERLGRAGIAVWRTDEQGTVTVTTDGHTFTVQGARGTAAFAARP